MDKIVIVKTLLKYIGRESIEMETVRNYMKKEGIA